MDVSSYLPRLHTHSIFHQLMPRFVLDNRFDVGAMLPWTQLFATSDRNEVEQICHEEGAPQPRWIGDNEDTFFQQWEDEPTQLHPITNDRVWFNHAQGMPVYEHPSPSAHSNI